MWQRASFAKQQGIEENPHLLILAFRSLGYTFNINVHICLPLFLCRFSMLHQAVVLTFLMFFKFIFVFFLYQG
jgi:hypothetical protein